MRVSVSRFIKCSTSHPRFVLQKAALSKKPLVASILRNDFVYTGTNPAHIPAKPESLPCLQLGRQWYATVGKQPCSLLHSCSWSLSAAKQKAVHVTAKGAKKYVVSLTPQERVYIQTALDECAQDDNGSKSPSLRQLRYVFYETALPFVGFGFLDNAIMIMAGEYIDHTMGIVLGISTMAAAGLGNLVSDLAGLGLADSVEALYRRLGLPDPRLTSSQLKSDSVRWTVLLGRTLGVTLGCIIGMAPLLWFDDSDCHKKSEEHLPPNS